MAISRYLILSTVGLWISWVDLRTRRIPHSLLFAMLALTILLYLFNPRAIQQALLAALIFTIVLLPISLMRSRSLGGGDTKLIILLALLLGSGDRMITALFFASIFALVYLPVYYLRDRSLPRSIAFAPALVCGALLSV
jgi:leader peptidase (prepilin peptidase) / N-methyltransferase